MAIPARGGAPARTSGGASSSPTAPMAPVVSRSSAGSHEARVPKNLLRVIFGVIALAIVVYLFVHYRG
jgi:hypothetical protein